MDDEAEAGPLPFPSRWVKLPERERSFESFSPVVAKGGGIGRAFLCGGTSWVLPIGVASRSWGGGGRPDGRCGWGASEATGTPLPATGRLVAEGGIPKVSLGGRGLLGLPRLPGTGALRRGTGDEDIARLFCLSPGKNNSLGSVVVARSAVFLVAAKY